MQKVILNFTQFSDGNLESKVHTIISNMTGNAAFPTPSPTIADVTTAATAYSAALITAKSGNRSDIADKNSKRQVLVDLLRSLAAYVNFAGNADQSVLLSSGFDLSKENQPVTITKPENFQVLNGINSGDLELVVNRVKGATAYLHEYTVDAALPATGWYSTASTNRRFVFSNLLPGKKYYCRTGAVGANGQLVYSDPLARIVI